MTNESLIEKVSEIVVNSVKKVSHEMSYYTGIGWEYQEGDLYKDFTSRKNQRNNVSPNNLLIRARFID